jgi:hypothetical protein
MSWQLDPSITVISLLLEKGGEGISQIAKHPYLHLDLSTDMTLEQR